MRASGYGSTATGRPCSAGAACSSTAAKYPSKSRYRRLRLLLPAVRTGTLPVHRPHGAPEDEAAIESAAPPTTWRGPPARRSVWRVLISHSYRATLRRLCIMRGLPRSSSLIDQGTVRAYREA